MAVSNKIYQYSVISALAQGLCSGGLPAAHVLSKGDHGIGTLADFDGELVIVDSQAYKFTSAGDAQPLDSSETVPFVMTTYFKPAKTQMIHSQYAARGCRTAHACCCRMFSLAMEG
ncbi:alpha-acetolactate decarboxylase-domain-containing protein [Aspergillus alliaceus]|uniref:alpha-acetolactate decarboxylase-domain-containing protein n=1 Tax=Petromyces alliaceus TaxID=209559 RepID=UPI0012A5051E|nr:alpha-acetolactate decarboxylase-domain-containing protein [Aspergillus alliaceus]KAB8228404.1 alpha-acetolactate decarboxylase-domain-containing protein [Aspergillus alliaceus]